MESKTRASRAAKTTKAFITSHSHTLRKYSLSKTQLDIANTPKRLALWHFAEIEIIKSLFHEAHMKRVNEKYHLPAGSKISEYLLTRGLSYVDFRLIQYMAGATPLKTNPIIASRRSHPLPQLEKRWTPFLEDTDEMLYQKYQTLFKELSTEIINKLTQPYFKKVRFMSALDFTHDLLQAADILEVPIEEVVQFVISEPVSSLLKTQVSVVSNLSNEATSESMVEDNSDEIAILNRFGIFSSPPASPALILPEDFYDLSSNELESVFKPKEGEEPQTMNRDIIKNSC